MADKKLITVPNDVDNPSILKKFLTELVGKLEGNPLITYPVNYTGFSSSSADVDAANTIASFMSAAAKTDALKGEVKRYIVSDLKTVVLQNKEDVAIVTEQYGTFYDTATAASWYGLGVKAGGVISGFTVGSIDTDTTIPGAGTGFFAINADSFQIAKSLSDVTDQAELDYLNANNLPYGTMYDATTQRVIPAFQIDWDANDNEYKIYFNGKVVFGNVSGTSHLLSEGDAISRLNNDLGYSTDTLAQAAYDLAQEAKQIADGVSTSWFYSYGAGSTPTLSNYPASNWTTDTDRANHVGDTTTNNDDGKSYRFLYDDSTSTYYWLLIADNYITLALNTANKALDTADGKRNVFTTSTIPGITYTSNGSTVNTGIGDLWIPNGDVVDGSTTYYNGELYRASAISTSAVTWTLVENYGRITNAIEANFSPATDVSYVSSIPASAKFGDYYINVDATSLDYKKVYRYEDANGSYKASLSWVEKTGAAANAILQTYEAQLAAEAAQNTADIVTSKVVDISIDSKLTPNEKISLLPIRQAIDDDKAKVVSIGNTLLNGNTLVIAYTDAYDNLINYLNPLFANMGNTEDITRSVFNSKFTEYYAAKANIYKQQALDAKTRVGTETSLRTAAITTLQTQTDKKINTSVNKIAPTNPDSGDYWYDTVNKLVKKFNGTDWAETQEVSADIFDFTDGKRAIFSNNTNTYPTAIKGIENGDVWIPLTSTGTAKTEKDGVTPIVINEVYMWEDTGWVKATKYTDDTTANLAIEKINSGFKSDFNYDSIDELNIPFKTGNGVVSVVTDTNSKAGGKVLKVTNGEGWLEFGDLIPYNPDKLYRIKVRVYQGTTARTERTYAGICAYDKDLNPINIHGVTSHSSQHYIAINSAIIATGSGWHEYIGYFTGAGVDGTSGGQHNNIDDPALVITGAKYFRPVLILNYPINGVNEARCDYLEIDEITDVNAVASDLVNFTDVVYPEDKANIIGLIDGKITTYYQSTAPYSAASGLAKDNGDLWYNSSTKELSRFNFSAKTWDIIEDTKAIQAIAAAETAQSTADNKIITFYQSAVPQSADKGDMWVTPNKSLLVYDGTKWVSTNEARYTNEVPNDDWAYNPNRNTYIDGDPVLVSANAMSLRAAGSAWAPSDRPILQLVQGAPKNSSGWVNINILKLDQEIMHTMEVSEGQVVTASAYIGAHRCKVNMSISFLDVNETPHLTYTSIDNNSIIGAAAENQSTLLSVRGTAPANTKFALLILSKSDTNPGHTSSYMFVHKPMMAIIDGTSPYGLTLPIPYVQGNYKLAKSDMSNVTTINGGLINTGRIASNDNSTYFDLANNQIKMNNGDFILDSTAAGTSSSPNIQGGYIKGTTIDGALVKAGRFVPSRPVTNTGMLTFYEGYLGFQTITQNTTGNGPYLQEVICYTGIASPSFNPTSVYNYFRLLGGQQTIYISKYVNRLNSSNYIKVLEYTCAQDIILPTSGVVKLGLSLYIGDTLIVEGDLVDLKDDKVADSYGYKYEPYIYDFNTGTYIGSKVYIDYLHNRVRMDLRSDISLNPTTEGEVKIVLRFHTTSIYPGYDYNSQSVLASSIYQTVTQTPQIVQSLGILI